MNLTTAIIVSALIGLVLFDFWVIAKKGKPESISAHIIRTFRKQPLVLFLSGMLIGHLVWSMKTEDVYRDTECKSKELTQHKQTAVDAD